MSVATYNLFDAVYCVNLPRTERRAAMERRLAQIGIFDAKFIHAREPIERFEICNMRRGPRGEFGANMSHIKAVARSIMDGSRRPLIIEDDVVFSRFDNMLHIEREMPSDWEVLYLGGHPRGPARQIGPHVAQITNFSFAEAYILNGVAGEFIQFWCDRMGQLNAMYDIILGEFAGQRRSFCAHPLITHQPDGYSFIAEKNDGKGNITERGWRNNLI